MLVIRDLQKKYRNYRLGYLWSLLEPLGMTLVLWLVFSVLLGARKLGLQPYVLFLTVAILPWWWFTKGVAASTRVFRRNSSQLLISMLPTQVWVLRVQLVQLAEFVVSLPVLIVAVVVTRTMPSPLIILFPVAVVLQFILMYGIALLISSWSLVVPDLERFVRIFMRAAFYLTPVLYSISNIPTSVQPLAALNPMVGVLGLYRIGFWPEEVESAAHYGLSLAISTALIVTGVIVFHRLEPRILKEA